jgi:formylglycine-generating enzyme required for sulfatase activity
MSEMRPGEKAGTPTDELTSEFEFETVTVDGRGEVTSRSTRRARQFAEPLGNGVVLEMVAIPEGSCFVGSRTSQGFPDEHPIHGVRFRPFLLGKYSATQEQWKAVTGKIRAYRCEGPKRPADRISWDEAIEFCAKLSAMTGRAYRLPSEAEWEHACRAGTATPFHFGETITTDLANYVGDHTYLDEPKGSYRHVSVDVGSLPPNAFGLHEMHGNVWEWCADGWHDDYVGAPIDGSVWKGGDEAFRVMRGGCWHDPPNLLRSASRLKFAHDDGEDFVGFRVALTSLAATQKAEQPRAGLRVPGFLRRRR